MKPSRFVLLLLVSVLATGCSKCAGVQEDKPNKESVKELNRARPHRFKMMRPPGDGGEGGVEAPDPSAAPAPAPPK